MENLKIGHIGEEIGCKFLKKKGFSIVERNYRKKFGEIDIVAEKRGIISFIEVKTTIFSASDSKNTENFRPEEKVDTRKLRNIANAVQAYLQERSIEKEWQFKVLRVIFDPNKKEARVKVIEDVLPE